MNAWMRVVHSVRGAQHSPPVWVSVPLLLTILIPMACNLPPGEPRWTDFGQQNRQPGTPPGTLTSGLPFSTAVQDAQTDSDETAGSDVDPRVQQFVARFPADDRDAQVRPFPSQSSSPTGQPAVMPGPSEQWQPPAQQSAAPAQAVSPPPSGPATAAPAGSSVASPALSANRPVAQPMQPVQAPPAGTAIQASPQPMSDVLLAPAPEPRRPRVELIDIRPATGTALPPNPAAAPSANQPVQGPGSTRSVDLASVVASLEESVKAHPEHLDEQFRLRLLYLATGQDDKAVGPIVAPDPVQAGLATALFQVVATAKTAIRQPTTSPAPALTAVDELRRLLGQQSPVIIPKIALVTRVNSFGDYEAVNPPRFPAGQGVHVFVYTEVANFRSEPTPDGRLRTLLSEKIEVFDSTGKVIWQLAADNIEDKVLTPRRDFFVPLELRLPPDTPAGEYTLKVTIEDKIGATTDQQRMTLTIGD